jgi:two-component system response regulator FixJ
MSGRGLALTDRSDGPSRRSSDIPGPHAIGQPGRIYAAHRMNCNTASSTPTIFLVEDDDNLRRSLEWFLVSHGYRVKASASIAQAMENYEPKSHGCLVLDVNLPEGTGLDLLKLFAEEGGNHPFVIMTAYGRVPMAVEAMKLGAVDFLEKPFEHDTLLIRVREAIEKDIRTRQQTAHVDELRELINRLGSREWQIAKLVARGNTSKEIAVQLGIKPKTVESHRRNLFLKLQVATATEASALIARAQSLADQGLLRLPD